MARSMAMAGVKDAEVLPLASDSEEAGADPMLEVILPPKPLLLRTPWATAAVLAALGLVATLSWGLATNGAKVDIKAPESVNVLSKDLLELDAPVVHADKCASLPHMRFTKVSHNNLGGKGPDGGPQTIEYEGIIFDPSPPHTSQKPGVKLVTLVLTAEGSYDLPPGTVNGLNGQYAKIWLNPGSEVKLHAHVVDRSSAHKGQPVVMLESYLTFFGIDPGPGGLQEQVYLKAAEVANDGMGHDVRDGTHIYHIGVSEPKRNCHHGSCEYVGVTSKGNDIVTDQEGTLPTQGTTLTRDHLPRIAGYVYHDTADYHFKLAVTPSTDSSAGPRTIAFASRPTNKCLSDDVCHDVAHMRLDRVSHSNLGGKGPDHGIATLDYKATWFGDSDHGPPAQHLILRFTATTPYDRPAGTTNGLHGQFGGLYFKPGTSTSLHVQVLDAHTGKPVALDKSYLTFILDSADHGRSHEKLCMSTPHSLPKLSKWNDLMKEASGECYLSRKAQEQQTMPSFPRTTSLTELGESIEYGFDQKSAYDFTISVSGGANPWNLVGFHGRPEFTCREKNPDQPGLAGLHF